jgi:hypothetical protein
MARVDIAYSNGSGYIFHNVDAAVGQGCPNNPLDVLLVQYLLKECNKLPGYAAVQVGAGFTQETMSITGANCVPHERLFIGTPASSVNFRCRSGACLSPIVEATSLGNLVFRK